MPCAGYSTFYGVSSNCKEVDILDSVYCSLYKAHGQGI